MAQLNSLNWLSSLRVGQKIRLGYALALGIAVSGTIAGFGIGNHYHQQNIAKQRHARNEVELLHRLQTGILQSRTHQQQLIPLSQFPEDFEAEYAHILHHKLEIEKSWADLKAFIQGSPKLSNHVHSQEVPTFLKTYEGVTSRYLAELEQRVKKVRALNLNSPQEVATAQKLLLEFTNSDLALQYDAISDDLVGLIDHAYEEVNQASELEQQSSLIAQRIVVGSVVLSMGIAVLLAGLISRTIAQPLQTLTQIAKRSTEESNFNLQAPIETQDETGILAHSLNQLIQSVKCLLEEQKIANEQLESYNEKLEASVEQRTQELNARNLQLQTLLDDLKRTQTHLVQAEKMSSLGQLVAGVAHEINNPVNFIHGNLTYVQEYATDLIRFVNLYQKCYPNPHIEIQTEAEDIDLDFLQEDLPKILNSMKIGTDRIRQIVLSLRNFSRTDEADFKAVDLHEGLDSTLLILQYRLKARPERPEIKVIRHYGQLPPVECHPGPVNQVFMNILANAIDALEETNLQRTYQEIEQNPSQIIIQTTLGKPGWVEIHIRDNGPGIPPELHQRIFEPFFTTKPLGKGTGMGMSISYQIITEQHGGNLTCVSQLGEGTEFVIELPIHQSAPENATHPSEPQVLTPS